MMIIPNIIFREAALVRRFRDPVRGFVSEGVAKAAGFRRDNSLGGGDASASSPEAN